MTVSSFRYNHLFPLYHTTEGIPFTLKNRSIALPEDKTHPMYELRYISINTPWTVLSHNIYGTIEYWWILSLANRSQVFYAEEGTEIKVIRPDVIDQVMADIVEESHL